jgi:hypothetical protein
MAVEVLRQTAARFLQNPELRELHFQEHFMRLFPDIFEGHTNSAVKCYVLECIQRLLRDLAQNLRSGWGVIFNLLTFAAVSPDTEDLGFAILSQIIDRNLPLLHTLLAPLLQTVSPFLSAPKRRIKVKAAEFYERIAREADLTDAIAWDSLIKGMARAASSQDPDVRRVLHEATISIAVTLIPQGPPEATVTSFLADGLPFYFAANHPDEQFFAQAAGFLERIMDEVIKSFWDQMFSRYFALVIRLLFLAICHQNQQLVATGIVAFSKFVKGFWQRFGEEEIALVLDILERTAPQIGAFTLSNAKAFVVAIVEVADISKRRKFVDVIARIDEACRLDDRLLELDAFVRQLLLSALIGLGDAADDIVECLRTTLAIFDEKQFGQSPDTEPGKAWNISACLATTRVADFPTDLFLKCFDASAPHIIGLVLADSLELRRQVKILVRRKLLG